jgi:hypothetical protein
LKGREDGRKEEGGEDRKEGGGRSEGMMDGRYEGRNFDGRKV